MEIEEITRRLQAAEAELIAHRAALSFLVTEASKELREVVQRAAEHLPDVLLAKPLTDQQLEDVGGHLRHLLTLLPPEDPRPVA
jgi:hypothetical protein